MQSNCNPQLPEGMVKNKKKKGSHQENKKSSHTNYHTNKNNENNNENNNELSANAMSSNRPCLLVGQFHCQQMQWNRNLHNETVSSNVKSRLKQMLPRSREEAERGSRDVVADPDSSARLGGGCRNPRR